MRAGFPVMFEVLPANVNERKAGYAGAPSREKRGAVHRGDSGYRDKGRAAVYVMDGVLLLTPAMSWAQARGVLRAACGVTAGASLCMETSVSADGD